MKDKTMSDTNYFRVHPTINFARVGNSEDYYVAPETAAGELIDKKSGLFGGLPIKKGTDNDPIDSQGFRDGDGAVMRQAARFKIFAYDQPQLTYPGTDHGREVKIGDKVGDKTIMDIVWTVHVANKKNNFFRIQSVGTEGEEKGFNIEEGIEAYEQRKGGGFRYPPIRDPEVGKTGAKPCTPGTVEMLANPTRLQQLMIDPGPRTIKSSDASGNAVNFNAATARTYAEPDGTICQAKGYPVNFPSDHFDMCNAYGPIDTLGQLRIEPNSGRLIVTGGYGKASAAQAENGDVPCLNDPIDNDGWFDDTSDGPVNAVILFNDGTHSQAVGGWCVTTDPSYAPQTRNVVSTWDDMFNAWVQKLDLMPNLYKNGSFNPDFQPSFGDDIQPIFHGAFLQRWNTNLPSKGVEGHHTMASITASTDPTQVVPDFKNLIRNPDDPDDVTGGKMPLALGDAGKSFLTVSSTQHFLMMQWFDGKSTDTPRNMGAGEKLDRAVLENCLGGRYSPGIDLTFIVRNPELFKQEWQGETGPFRIDEEVLDYSDTAGKTAFLGVGYVPNQPESVQPGDLSKFMSQPWHTDYNSCAIHEPDPNPVGNNTLYWSWPAQRPVQVYPADLCIYEDGNWYLGQQRFSVRGDGEGNNNLTHTDWPQNVGKYQEYIDFVKNWHKVGFIIQGTQIADTHGGNYGDKYFLEVASQFTLGGDSVRAWPTANIPDDEKPSKTCAEKRVACAAKPLECSNI
jgi:hypothetical protein